MGSVWVLVHVSFYYKIYDRSRLLCVHDGGGLGFARLKPFIEVITNILIHLVAVIPLDKLS